MTARDQIIVADRFRRALLALQTAGWADPGVRVRGDIRAAAVEVVEAYQALTAAGLNADAADNRLVSQARQYLVEGKA
jgi:hypothetical protein